MPEVDPDDVARFLDWRNPDTEQAVDLVTALAKAYTRGRGFDGDQPNADVAAVIKLASARLAANPRQLLTRLQVGHAEYEVRSSFQGFTIPERAVLDRYRVTAG